MNSRQLIARLKADNWYKVGGKGSHQKFKHDEKPGHVIVPHPKKDLPEGTVRSIFKQASWEWK
ncbi:MAG: type II toxin-antitoxin system HicA family toxin [Gammaproteobacteria bacterium]|nr:type II toxin-antitoxin system HicA family toxin [Gammaproteobacteria bacterium]